MILECWFYMFRGIYRHLIKAQEQIYSRFVQNVKLVKHTFSTRRGDTRTTAWACATCLLFENLLPVASYSRRVSDLKVPIVAVRYNAADHFLICSQICKQSSALVGLIYESPANPPPTNLELLTFLRHTALLTIVTRLVVFPRWRNTRTAFRPAFK